MNLCFLKGKIVSQITFEFILNSKNTAIAMFKIEIDNKSILQIKAYNEMADKCYKKLVRNDGIVIQGNLNSNMEIILKDFDYLL